MSSLVASHPRGHHLPYLDIAAPSQSSAVCSPRIRLSSRVKGYVGGTNLRRTHPEVPHLPCISLLCPLFANRDRDAKILVGSQLVEFACCVVLDCLLGSPGLGHHQSRSTKAAQFLKGLAIWWQLVHHRKCQRPLGVLHFLRQCCFLLNYSLCLSNVAHD